MKKYRKFRVHCVNLRDRYYFIKILINPRAFINKNITVITWESRFLHTKCASCTCESTMQYNTYNIPAGNKPWNLYSQALIPGEFSWRFQFPDANQGNTNYFAISALTPFRRWCCIKKINFLQPVPLKGMLRVPRPGPRELIPRKKR